MLCTNICIIIILTLFYTRGLEIVVLHVMVLQPYRFSPCFFIILEFSSKWVKVMLPYREGGGLPVVGVGGSLMTHSAGSVTTQKKAFKYVMASKPYSTPDISNRSWQVCHTLRFTFFKTLIALK
jgi:hypothetical protein